MFKISTRTRYGIRALLELAQSNQTKPLTLKDIADNQNISLKYLESIFKLLKNRKIVKSTRGPGGGYQLRVFPDELLIYDIFEAIDGPLVTIECITNPGNCAQQPSCRTRLFWEDLQQHILSFLQTRTLQDVLDKMPENDGSWYANI